MKLPRSYDAADDQTRRGQRFRKKPLHGGGYHAKKDKPADDPVDNTEGHRTSSLANARPLRSHIQLASRKLGVRLEVLLAGAARHFRGKRGSGWLLIPVNLLEVIPNVLLVVRILGTSRGVFICGPETRRIGRKNFIGERDAVLSPSELEFSIGDD